MKIFNLFVTALTFLNNFPAIGGNIYFQHQVVDDSLLIVEKVYLHTDRDTYYPGDNIWFKAYLVEAQERSLSDNSNNLHVELISPDLKVIDSRIVKLSEGLGNGDFRLSESFKSGKYRIRAYTNYMRNYSDQLFFRKDITVINPSDAAKRLSDSTNYVRDKVEIQFFPEGGSLVENVPSIVAFKAVNALGEGCDVSGNIYSSTGEMIVAFKSDHLGMGSFSINPVEGLSYYAVAKNVKGEEVKSELLKSFSTGLALNVTKTRSNQVAITVRTNVRTLPLVTDQDLSIIVSARKVYLKKADFRMNSLANRFILPIDDLPEGIVMLTLSGLNNMPLCERLVYIGNNEEVKVKVETDKAVYKQRDSVSVRISLSDKSGAPELTFLSLAATEIFSDDGSSRFPSIISSWFLLESDVHGVVEEPSYYFDPANNDRLRHLDLLLLTQGWRDFEWKYKDLKYPPEYGFTISGRVRKKFANVPLENSSVTVALFKSGNPQSFSLPVDSSGRFKLEAFDYTGDAKLIASVTGNDNTLKGWLLLDSLKYSPVTVKESIVPVKFIQNNDRLKSGDNLLNESKINKRNLRTYIQYSEIKNSTEKKYKLSDTITPGEVTIRAKVQDWTETPRSRSRHYLMGTPDYEVVISPILKGYGTAYNLVSNRYLSQASMPRWAYNPKIQNPLYLIDGNKAEEGEVKALSLDWVERIDVIQNAAAMSTLRTMVASEGRDSLGRPIMKYNYADGAISIILKEGYYEKSIYHSSTMKFSGYNEPRIFYSPKHHTSLEKDYKPDLRTTLFWEPNIIMENGKEIILNYYNADNSSNVRVALEGITSTGIPVTGKAEYEVK